ncbi:hypothetical protein AHAS_Ahas06G0075500 [Arachis hypogaea]
MLPSVNSSSLLLPIAVSITEPLFLPLTLSRIRFALLIFLARTQKGQRCKTHLRVPIFAAVPLRPSVPAASRFPLPRLCFVGNAENIMKEAGPVSMTFDIPMYHALRLQARDLISKITEERNSIIDQNKKPQQELVLAATQVLGQEGQSWFQGTADAIRQFHWLFEELSYFISCALFSLIACLLTENIKLCIDPRAKNIEDVLMLSGDHRLYRMNYIDLIQVYRESKADLCIDCKRRCGWKVGFFVGDTINMFM